MPQVVSKNLAAGLGDVQKSTKSSLSKSTSTIISDGRTGQAWKRPLSIAFHGTAASIYGYAIGWQNVSQAAYQLYLRSNPYVRVYGRLRFLTYNCLIIQFVAYALCLTSHFVPRLRRPRDFFFTTFAFPVGLMVVSTFWTIWFAAGREYIFPASLEPYYPPWLNHITHTIIGPINLIELLAIKKQYSRERTAITALTGYTLLYTSYLLYIRWQTGRYVYPFLNHMSAVPIGAFIAGMVVFVLASYKGAKLLHDFFHGVRSYRCNTETKVKKKR